MICFYCRIMVCFCVFFWCCIFVWKRCFFVVRWKGRKYFIKFCDSYKTSKICNLVIVENIFNFFKIIYCIECDFCYF